MSYCLHEWKYYFHPVRVTWFLQFTYIFPEVIYSFAENKIKSNLLYYQMMEHNNINS